MPRTSLWRARLTLGEREEGSGDAERSDNAECAARVFAENMKNALILLPLDLTSLILGRKRLFETTPAGALYNARTTPGGVAGQGC